MQYKYIKQVIELYDDFHLVFMPLEDQEVRGTDRLTEYGNKLFGENACYKCSCIG